MKTMLTSAAAKILRVSESLVREYANKGQIRVLGRNSKNQRLLDPDDVERIRLARRALERPGRCRRCGDLIPGRGDNGLPFTYCQSEKCTKARQRVRAKNSYWRTKAAPATTEVDVEEWSRK